MEVALRENRMTLEAIKLTQRDRDLFKHLITESTNYVASDYMRIANERRAKIERLLNRRGELFGSRRQMTDFQTRYVLMAEELGEIHENQSQLEADYQAALDHLQRVQAAVKQQEKVNRYLEDLEELAIRLEEQNLVVEEAREQLQQAEEQTQHQEEEVDSLKSQLADYQQALDIQQTRALQYQQALTALEKARELSDISTLDVDAASELLKRLKKQEEEQTSAVLNLKHQVDLSSANANQFDTGLKLVQSILPDTTRDNVATHAAALIEKHRESKHLAQNLSQIEAQFKELDRQMRAYQQAQSLSQDYLRQCQVTVQTEADAEIEFEKQQERLENAEIALENQADQLRDLERNQTDLKAKITALESTAPAWLKANTALEKLIEQSGESLENSQAVLDTMQNLMNQERQLIDSRDRMAKRKTRLESEIEKLSQPGGSEDSRLQSIADTLGGTLLAEIYDEITIDDAPYFSALYGPARHAIVVPDLKGIQEKLASFDDCPDDLYIIEGDVDGFDDSVFNVDDMEGAVCVYLNDRQIRYSRFPKIPLFGRAAREHRLDALREEREGLVEEFAKVSFDAQKIQRLNQSFQQFVSEHFNVAFQANPEDALKTLREQRTKEQRQVTQLKENETQMKQQISAAKSAISMLNKLQHLVVVLEDDTLAFRREETEQKLQQADEAKAFIEQHADALNKIENIISSLRLDPQQFEQLNQNYQDADEALQQTKRQSYALSDLVERRHHFSYADAVSMLDQSGELNDQLKAKLVEAESKRTQGRDQVKTFRESLTQYHQVLVSLKSSHQAKLETVNEFKRELVEIGVRADAESEQRALLNKTSLNEQLAQSRQRKSELEKGTTAVELEMKSLEKSLKKVSKEYGELRTFVVNAKAGWVEVLKIARTSQVEKQLNRREMAYMSAEDLRSLSDKSLGALRLAVADNEILRDALRASEDNARPERKVLFYVAVYQHLRERIRQDIIRSDDPIDAIEEMEIELARLTEELTQREKRLAISSESVANIIRKTIQREQNRIRMLNQGLSNIGFGQVTGVRLNVGVRETHAHLLEGLSEKNDLHQDLFNNSKLTFSEAIAKLFQRLNPHIELGQRSPQVLGEELLDYRNYLELSIEVHRGADGWLQAESGALSTGEAIGTGQAILLMVVQSWEEESRRLRGKDVIPCRLLFLDEAARLDAKSISTLFELCHRLDMQLLIAAPENISPDQGTTYKLVRKIFNDKEHVHVVGLRGFAEKPISEQSAEKDLTTESPELTTDN